MNVREREISRSPEKDIFQGFQGPLDTLKMFCAVFRGYKMETMDKNGLI